MSCEICTPTNGIIGMIETVSLMGVRDKQYEYMCIIKDASRQYLQII
ncbi:hypothetical protein DSUL_50165 [Desulfovibrionales bacterium]